MFTAIGPGAKAAFAHESGGHRHQRVPPTEKRGRIHTSTVTVAVLTVPSPVEIRLDERDLEWTACRATGSGGQALQKSDSAVQLTHRPTGLQVRVEADRSQHRNKATALALLRARLLAAECAAADRARNAERRAQLGSGQRGDKVRTYRHQDGVVTDHASGRKATLDRVRRGFLEDLR